MSLQLPDRFGRVQFREADIEAVDADEGTALLRAAPYDVEAQIDHDLWESFAPTTFERAANAPSRVKFYQGHSDKGGALIGHALSVEDKSDGPWVRMKFSNTVAGIEARELAADGTLDQCSIEFRPMREFMKVTHKPDGLHVRHSRAHLLGVALIPHGAYAENAMVMSVRDAGAKAREAALARLRSLSH